MRHFLTIENGKLVDYPDYSDTPVEVTSVQQLQAMMEADPLTRIMCSSSIDFPEEYTSDPVVLELVAALWSAD